jgi:hypothetical protein
LNEVLELKIKSVGALLATTIFHRGDCPESRKLQDELDDLRAQRTPQDHAEMARKMGLPA